MTDFTNVHPVDELSAIREEIAMLQSRADEIRDGLLEEGADLIGDQHKAVVIPGKRETLDRKALTDMFGEKAIAPFVKTTAYRTVKITER